jgi:hypothetical protein
MNLCIISRALLPLISPPVLSSSPLFQRSYAEPFCAAVSARAEAVETLPKEEAEAQARRLQNLATLLVGRREYKV